MKIDLNKAQPWHLTAVARLAIRLALVQGEGQAATARLVGVSTRTVRKLRAGLPPGPFDQAEQALREITMNEVGMTSPEASELAWVGIAGEAATFLAQAATNRAIASRRPAAAARAA